VDAGADAATDSGSDAAVDSGQDAELACATIDVDGDGESSCTDCDDNDSSRYHGATETCDGDDEDCDDTTFGPDMDGDGFVSIACCNGAGNCGTDCNDALNTVNPGAAEVCDSIDDDCDGSVDEGVCLPCPTGYGGFDGSCTDLNECAVSSFCGTGSIGCSNLPGTFSCSCGPGFIADAPTGALCHDIDECAAAVSPCGTTGTCTNTTGSYTCGCDAGYTPGSGGCVDVNECATNPCGSTSTSCTNTTGSYTCACVPGYAAGGIGGGGTCADIPECDTLSTCGQSLSAVNTCFNTAGSYTCNCGAGFTLTGSGLTATCVDNNECSVGAPCGAGATCANIPGSYSCTCPSGYAAPASGGTCTDVNECAVAATCGTARASCTNSAGSYACTCNTGYSAPATGGACTDIDECLIATTCGATRTGCTNQPGTYVCACAAGYAAPATGGACADVNECTLGTDDCFRDTVIDACVNSAGAFDCYCPRGYAGAGHGVSGCGPQFTNLGGGLILDNGTGLTWQQSFSAGTMTQAAAIAYCTGLGGGWRLPTVDELTNITDPRRYSPAIDPAFFPGVPPGGYFWSSSASGAGSNGFAICYTNGMAETWNVFWSYYARCVRP
jgi:hypothetical protein